MDSKTESSRRGLRGLIVGVMLCLAIATVVSGCGGSSSGGSSSTSSGSEKLGLGTPGTLAVGSNIPFPPFEQGEPPAYEGFDVELIDTIAKKLGLEVKIQNSSFQTLVSDVQAGKFDVAISAMVILPEREKVVAFSDPYFDVQLSLVVQKGSSLKTMQELSSSTIVGVEQGGTNQEYAEGKTSASVQAYPNGAAALNALQAGQVEAVIYDYPAAATIVGEKYPDLEVAQVVSTSNQYGIAMQKTNPALKEAIDRELAALIKDGTYEKIYQKWFSATPPAAFRSSK